EEVRRGVDAAPVPGQDGDDEGAAVRVQEPGVVPDLRGPPRLVQQRDAAPAHAVEAASRARVREEIEEVARVRGREGASEAPDERAPGPGREVERALEA